MILIVDSYGAKINIENKMIVVRTEDEIREFSPHKVEKVIISFCVSLTGEFISICSKHNIDVVFLDKYNYPCSRIWNNKFGSISTIRRNQLKFFENNQAFALIKKWQADKIGNMLKHMGKFQKYNQRDSKYFMLMNYKKNIEKVDINLSIEDFRKEIFKSESVATKIYLKFLNSKLPEKYVFKAREKKNSKDKYSSVLNYSFGILYNYIERELIIAGLDPSLGILHIDNYAKVPLVYDLIEKYRYLSYETTLELLNEEEFIEDDFIILEDKLILGRNVRKMISVYFKKRLESEKYEITKYLKKIAKLILEGDFNGLCDRL